MTQQQIYAIGDIHGQHEMLLDALTRIEADGGTAAPVVFLGDLVDRGPDSRAVIDTLLTGIDQGRDWTVLRGNHDQLFLDYLNSGTTTSPLIRSDLPWFNKALGGSATLASYGVDMSLTGPERLTAARAAVPEAHRSFLAGLPFYHTSGPLLFVHAGIRPGVALTAQSNDDMIWIREPFLSHNEPFDHLVIHGHTAVTMPRHYGNRINLDSGAGWGRPLTAALISPPRAFVLTDTGRIPLIP